MKKFVKIFSIIIYSITAIAGFLFAALYLFRPEFMPYHEVAVGRPWIEVSNEYQVLILALMRVGGGGFLATSVGISILLLGPFRRGMFWPNYGIPFIALSALVPTFIATLYVRQNSPANPPYIIAGILIGLIIIALLLSVIFRKHLKS